MLKMMGLDPGQEFKVALEEADACGARCAWPLAGGPRRPCHACPAGSCVPRCCADHSPTAPAVCHAARRLVYGDRDAQQTLRRLSETMSVPQMMQMATGVGMPEPPAVRGAAEGGPVLARCWSCEEVLALPAAGGTAPR